MLHANQLAAPRAGVHQRACMLRGGTELLEHAKKRLEIGHKEVTKDGVFSLEEVECIGAVTGALRSR